VAREYDLEAARYDQRWQTYVGQTTAHALERLRVHPNERLLDVGCGTGCLLAAVAATRPDVHLYGIDLSPAMLDQARQRLGSYAMLQKASADRLPFSDGEFDQLVSVSTLHCLPDAGTVFEAMARVLKPGGRLLISDWCRESAYCRWLCRYLRIKGIYARALGVDTLIQLARRAGFMNIATERFQVARRWPMLSLTARRADNNRPW